MLSFLSGGTVLLPILESLVNTCYFVLLMSVQNGRILLLLLPEKLDFTLKMDIPQSNSIKSCPCSMTATALLIMSYIGHFIESVSTSVQSWC